VIRSTLAEFARQAPYIPDGDSKTDGDGCYGNRMTEDEQQIRHSVIPLKTIGIDLPTFDIARRAWMPPFA
jgi:hypothetical protein